MRDFPQGCVPFWLDLIPPIAHNSLWLGERFHLCASPSLSKKPAFAGIFCQGALGRLEILGCRASPASAPHDEAVRPFRVMWLLPLGAHTRHVMDRRTGAQPGTDWLLAPDDRVEWLAERLRHAHDLVRTWDHALVR